MYLNKVFFVAACVPWADATLAAVHPSLMKAAQASGIPCEKPDWSCITENTEAPVPHPEAGQMLVAMKGASVNPIDVEFVEPGCKTFMGCSNTTVGMDGAGVVIEVNACEGFNVGDEVWMTLLITGRLYAEYAVIPCAAAGLKPKALSFVDAGTIPMVGTTSLLCLQAAGKPLTNLTVAVTSGQGGTGFMGVQLAKALGAAHVITAATGEGIDLMKQLGADTVIDYHKQDIFEALGDDSIDVVYDNFGLPGTADKAMHSIRKGGVFMILPSSKQGKPSDHPKSGVHQVPNCRNEDFGPDSLAILAKFFDAGKLQPRTMSPTYSLSEIPQAFTRLLTPGVVGKIAIVPTSTSALHV